MSQEQTPHGPDLAQGISLAELEDGGMLAGHCGGEEVLLVRRGSEIFAVGAHCSHYHGPLADGLVVNDTVRCPWHHAAFDLRTGEATRAPALSPISCWSVEQRDGKVFVKEKRTPPKSEPLGVPGKAPDRIVIVGGGAAGFAAAEMLRRRAYQGSIVMVSSEAAPPVDRPNLSKDYLAGTAPEEWVPLRPDSFYAENGIDLRLGEAVTGVDTRSRKITLSSGGDLALRPPSPRNRRRANSLAYPRLQRAACLHSSLAGRLPGHHRARRDREPGCGDWCELHRAGGCGVVACARAGSSCRRARSRGRWSASSVRRWATSCALCTKSMA